VLEVSEGGLSLVQPDYGGVERTAGLSALTPVSLGQIQVHANVSMRFKIETK
jgi:hypothetical protein